MNVRPYDKVVLENGGTLMFVLNCYKNHKMCNKAFNNYDHALEFVPDSYKALKMCYEAVDTCPFVLDFFPD